VVKQNTHSMKSLETKHDYSAINGGIKFQFINKNYGTKII